MNISKAQAQNLLLPKAFDKIKNLPVKSSTLFLSAVLK